ATVATATVAAAGDPTSADVTGWVAGTLTLFMMGLLIVVSLNYLMPRLAAAIEQGRRLARELAGQRDRLEEEVTARTRDLVRQSARLEAAAQVARDAAAIQDVGQLLEETVRLISTRFGFYHTGIFLLDEKREYAVLRAASSEGGQRMLDRGHRLRVSETGEAGEGTSPLPSLPVGIVGYVTRQGQPRIALDVGADAAYFDNPDLPQTRSEVALPLRARGEIIGALDVQSVEPEAFTEEDVEVLQTLADQVAVAISNARLFQRAEESLEAERRAYGEISREAWRQMVGRRAERGFRCDTQGIVPLDAGLSMTRAGGLRAGSLQPDVQAATVAGATATVAAGAGAAMDGQVVVGEEDDRPTVSVPIPIRDQVVGVLNFRKASEGETWSEEELALLQTMAGQLGQALESARLYQDSQRRAAEEQLLGEVMARVRETLDVDAVLQTAIREMGVALGLSRVEVRMGEGELFPQAGAGVGEGGEHVGAD
ncbi:MAG: GAF domain-containing protein, partial [Anaerolineae bacterium]|nr:GAF domain-containing protein [Anaerolineae bacterium]